MTQKWKSVLLTVIFKEILNWRQATYVVLFFKLSSGVEKTVNIYHLITWISMVFIFSCQLNIKWLISCWDIILSVLTCNDDILFVIVLFQEKKQTEFHSNTFNDWCLKPCLIILTSISIHEHLVTTVNVWHLLFCSRNT